MINRRHFLATGAALAGAARRSAASPTRGDWFRKSPRVFLLDFQMPDPVDQGVAGMPHFFQKLDPRSLVEGIARANANVLLVHAKDNQGNAYYNTSVSHKHSDLGARDLMADMSRLCRERGLVLLFYVQLSRERRSFTHPERQARDAQGRGVVFGKSNPMLVSAEESPVVCMNGPHREYTKEILAELARGYDFDGFWLDCYNWWGRVNPCYCDFCQASYQRDTGRTIPQPKQYREDGRDYMRWRSALNSRIMHELCTHIHALNPRLTVTHNASGVATWVDWEFCDGDDYVSHEFHFSEGHNELSLLCKRNNALKPGGPFEIEIWRFENGRGTRASARAYQVRNVPVQVMEMATVAAHGGFAQYYDQVRPDGTLEPRSMAILEPAFAEVKSRQPWVGKGEAVPFAALLWSKATEAYAPAESRELHGQALSGCHHALVEKHLPVTVISERDVAAGRWRGTRVVVADAAECLDRDTIAGLDKFVQDGGGLVVTHRTSMRDGNGDARPDFGLAGLLGVHYAGMTGHWYGFLNLESRHPLTEGLPLDFPMTVFKTLQVKVKTEAAEVLGTIVDPLPGFQMGYPPHEHTGIPALVVRRHGKGRVVYAGAALGAIYAGYSHADNRQLIANAVEWAAGGPSPVTARAPETVEVLAWHDAGSRRTIIHVVNRTGAGLGQGEGAVMHEAIPVHDIQLRISASLGRGAAKAQPGNRSLKTRVDGDWTLIDLGPVQMWEVVEIA
jgi:type 1 glutamine amidotransferase